MKKIILSFVFIWFFIGSLAHFIFTGSEAKIIPDYIPWHMADVYVSGFLEMLGALGLLSKKTRPYAGFGLFCLTIAVTPANVYMAMHASKYPDIAPWILNARLVFQLIFLWMISWSSEIRWRLH